MLNNFMRSLMALLSTIMMVVFMASPVANMISFDIRAGVVVGGILLVSFLALVTVSNTRHFNA